MPGSVDIVCAAHGVLHTAVGDTAAELGERAAAALLAAHAEHYTCTLSLGRWQGDGGARLALTCRRCQERRVHESAPQHLVAALTLAFHSEHEGHRLGIRYGEVDWV